MSFLQKLLGSESPKLERPFALSIGYLLQRIGLSERLRIKRSSYELPFFARSNIALTYWACPEYSDVTELFLYRFLKPGHTFVDVGANVGCLSACASAIVGAAGRVLALEPHPQTYLYLAETIQVNGCRNVTCHNLGASDRAGVTFISDRRRKDDNNRLVEHGERRLSVATVRLADFIRLNGIAAIDLLKIDVEGLEWHVLAGLIGHDAQITCIYIESIDKNLKKYGKSDVDLKRLLSHLGFQLYQLPGDDANLVCFADPEAAASFQGELREVQVPA